MAIWNKFIHILGYLALLVLLCSGAMAVIVAAEPEAVRNFVEARVHSILHLKPEHLLFGSLALLALVLSYKWEGWNERYSRGEKNGYWQLRISSPEDPVYLKGYAEGERQKIRDTLNSCYGRGVTG